MYSGKVNTKHNNESTIGKNTVTFFQPKYSINKPDDIYEQETDSIAEKVVQSKVKNLSEPFFKPAVQIQNRIQRQEAEPESEKDLEKSYTLPDFFDRRLDWFEMSRPFSSRGAESYLYLDEKLHLSVGNVWTKNYKFFFDFGFGDKVSADAANFFTPFTIDSALKRDFPTQSEMFERNADISSIVISPTVFTFDISDIPGTLRMPFFSIFGADKSNPYSRKKKVQRKCKECEEEDTLQRKNLNTDEVKANNEFESYVDNLNSGGVALSSEARSFFEPRFGYDFSKVKIHNDPVAAKSAQSINALAYTSGNNIVFNQNQYSPETDTGKKLLAHELTHVVQQGQNIHPKKIQRTIGDDNDLSSPRFKGDVDLEACFDGEKIIRFGSRGEPVRKIQLALIDAGFPLPTFGADSIFGAETKAAVKEFQKQAGLDFRNQDGEVGPITLSRLDSRFTGSSANTTEHTCESGIKTVTIDFAMMKGATGNPAQDIAFANSVFSGCCIEFRMGTQVSISDSLSDSLLGGDTDLLMEGCGAVSAEDLNTFLTVSSLFGLTNPIIAFYVGTLHEGTNRLQGVAVSGLCATGPRSPMQGMIAIANDVENKTFPHELAHILMNAFADHRVTADNLQHVSRGSTGVNIAPVQCAIMYTRV
jgi:hypothetical protein